MSFCFLSLSQFSMSERLRGCSVSFTCHSLLLLSFSTHTLSFSVYIFPLVGIFLDEPSDPQRQSDSHTWPAFLLLSFHMLIQRWVGSEVRRLWSMQGCVKLEAKAMQLCFRLSCVSLIITSETATPSLFLCISALFRNKLCLRIFPVTMAIPLKHQEVCFDLYCFPIYVFISIAPNLYY